MRGRQFKPEGVIKTEKGSMRAVEEIKRGERWIEAGVDLR